MSSLTRRNFLQSTSLAAASTFAAPAIFADNTSPNEKVVLGVMGTSGRGTDLARSFAQLKNCEVAYVCDVDKFKLNQGVAKTAEVQSTSPQPTEDFRTILDDKNVDALVVAAPDHWHAPAGIMGCQAGKHVYVEKPCSHNPHEGELFIQAARKHDRHVQMGTQRRSRPGIAEGMQKLHDGVIGEVLYARCHYYNARGSIGNGMEAPVPERLNWDLWQGPAPRVNYRDNIVHYNWHWFWHWGTAELGNNGVHYLDVLRWGMGVDYPDRVSCTGGKLRHEGDQETPDTSIATFHFGNKFMVWEQRSWAKKTKTDTDSAMQFFGTKGSLEITGDAGYTVYDLNGKKIDEGSGVSGQTEHLENFLSAVRGNAKLNCEIEEGHKSTLLCHLGNIAYRLQRPLVLDPKSHQIVDDEDAMASMWSREYNEEFAPKVG